MLIARESLTHPSAPWGVEEQGEAPPNHLPSPSNHVVVEDPKAATFRVKTPFLLHFREGRGSERVRGAPRIPRPPCPAPFTWPHRLHQDDAVPADGEAEAMLVLLDDDAALDQTCGGMGGRTSEAPSLGWVPGLLGPHYSQARAGCGAPKSATLRR